jgi:N-acetylmuramoyl-L-alanine amidase
MKFCVDPGHGMSNRREGVYDPGAQCTEGGTCYNEADINLKYGLTLRDVLWEQGHQVFMTRESHDDPAPVVERAGNAEAEGCDAYISLHVNADPDDQGTNGLLICYRHDEYSDLAKTLRNALCDVTTLKRMSNQKRTDLAVLKFDGPAVLIELGFIGNNGDRETLLNSATCRPVCERIAQVVVGYLV